MCDKDRRAICMTSKIDNLNDMKKKGLALSFGCLTAFYRPASRAVDPKDSHQKPKNPPSKMSPSPWKPKARSIPSPLPQPFAVDA